MSSIRYGVLVNVGFVAIFALLASFFLVTVNCPYCGGTGHVQIGGKSQELKVIGTTTAFVAFPDGCETNNVFWVTVNTTLLNEGNTTWNGWVEGNIVEAHTGRWNSTTYVEVQVGPGSTKSFAFSVVANIYSLRVQGFWGNPDFETSVAPAAGVIPCPLCGGTGRINLISWLVDVIKGEGNKPEIGLGLR